MKLMSYDKYMKMSKAALIRKITKALRVMPKAKLARLCYNITKSKLPRLSIRETKKLSYPLYGDALAADRYVKRYKTRKFSRKQIAAQKLFARRAKAGTLRKRKRRR